MPHHFNKATVEAMIFCPTCMRETPWKIADGRRQFCKVCAEKTQERHKKDEPQEESKQANLFGEGESL